jgi:hypothetical protein
MCAIQRFGWNHAISVEFYRYEIPSEGQEVLIFDFIHLCVRSHLYFHQIHTFPFYNRRCLIFIVISPLILRAKKIYPFTHQ